VGTPVNLLSIETATPACAIGVATSSGVELALVLDGERHHTETLTPGIRDLLYKVELSAKSIDRVVVDRGPGLYTGLRVGIATALGLALGAGAELVGVTSLEVLARGAFAAGVAGTLVSVVDARRGEVFVQTFALGASVLALDEPRVAWPHDVASESRTRSVASEWRTSGDTVTFTGDGAARYVEEFDAVPHGSIFDQRVPAPGAALFLGAQREPEATIVPLYLREADAVANFSTRQRLS
jgi:tRNA threonylcarbamoyl adenosine modification protein YeaZ